MLVLIIAAFKYTLVGVYGPRQNLLRYVVITFSFNNCFRHSYSKMCKNVTDSGHHNYSDVSMSSFGRIYVRMRQVIHAPLPFEN